MEEVIVFAVTAALSFLWMRSAIGCRKLRRKTESDFHTINAHKVEIDRLISVCAETERAREAILRLSRIRLSSLMALRSQSEALHAKIGGLEMVIESKNLKIKQLNEILLHVKSHCAECLSYNDEKKHRLSNESARYRMRWIRARDKQK